METTLPQIACSEFVWTPGLAARTQEVEIDGGTVSTRPIAGWVLAVAPDTITVMESGGGSRRWHRSPRDVVPAGEVVGTIATPIGPVEIVQPIPHLSMFFFRRGRNCWGPRWGRESAEEWFRLTLEQDGLAGLVETWHLAAEYTYDALDVCEEGGTVDDAGGEAQVYVGWDGYGWHIYDAHTETALTDMRQPIAERWDREATEEEARAMAERYAEERQAAEDSTPEGMRRCSTSRAAFWDGC